MTLRDRNEGFLLNVASEMERSEMEQAKVNKIPEWSWDG